jgi:hypothetical protein
VLARYARNGWLAAAIHRWAFCSLRASPGARACHDELRARGKSHNMALRQLGNRLAGSCTAAWKPAPATTSTPPGHTATASPNPPPPDLLPFLAPRTDSCPATPERSQGSRPAAGPRRGRLDAGEHPRTLTQQESGKPGLEGRSRLDV